MTPATLERALIDLGWLALIQRALGGKPSSSYALHQLMRGRGAWVTMQALAEGYAIAAGRATETPKNDAITMRAAVVQRVSRLRGHLEDIGLDGVIQVCNDQHAYRITPRDLSRVQAGLLSACGFQLEAEDIAA